MTTKQENLLREALTIYNQAVVEKLPDVPEYAPTYFSKRYQHRMERLFRRYDRFYYPAIRTKARRALTLAATLILLFAATMTVSAARESFTQFVTVVYDVCTDLFFPSSDDSAPFIPADPTYLPEGFTEIDRETDETSNCITYHNKDEKELYYKQIKTRDLAAGINTENAQVEKLILQNNTEAMYVYRQDFSIICFTSGGCYYEINSLLSREELVKIANSVLQK